MSELRPDELERGVLALWERAETFAESLKRRAGAPLFSFYDGPPYATGLPHYGNLLQSAVKDAVTRYWTMRGLNVDRRVGWDCHGLPVEHMVERELGIKTKREIEERGIDVFNAACRAAVLRHVDHWTKLLRRLGRWADYAQPYFTMDAAYIESTWWVFKQVWERGLVTRGVRSAPYCPRCETPLSHHEVSLGYKDVTDPAITVKVRLADEGNTYLLVWTTTPWTLPANVAVAVHPDLRYARVKVGEETWILAKERIAASVHEEHQLVDEFSGSALAGRTYQPIFEFVEPDKAAYLVVAAPFVSGQEGTGVVHVAPAFGEEDFRLAEEENLPIIQTVDAAGRFLPVVKPWAGQFVKDADAAIMEDLDQRGMLLQRDTIRHAYPHCWRCETPLLYLATTSWFIAVTRIKDQLLRNAEQIRWVPAHLKEGRFGQGLKDAPDWAVSRTRYWGIPLPVWECAACATRVVIGSIAELRAAGGDLSLLTSPHANPDLHRPYVDRVMLRCPACSQDAKRVPEVLDVWFDSGSMPYAQWHYPFENRGRVENAFPADFIGEALEMTRGWFYTLHVLAGILTLTDIGLGIGKPAYKYVVASGLILAEDGRKLSKRFGNYPDPAGLVEKYGADTLRLFLLAATNFGEDLRFSERLVGDLYRRFTLILWNVWEYYRTYSLSRHPERSEGSRSDDARDSSVAALPQNDTFRLLDRWILARTAQLVRDVRAAMDAYHLDDASRALLPFVDDLSTWYVRRSRGREEALPVLREVLRQCSLVAAPFIPFLAEHIHRELTGRSPHLEDFPSGELPKFAAQSSEVDVLGQMRAIRALAAAGHRARAEAKIKVRQPLAEVAVVGDFPALAAAGAEGLALLRDELNVKSVILRSPQTIEGSGRPMRRDSSAAPQNDNGLVWIDVVGGKIGLNIEITEELKQEGIVRDLMRHIQDLRKQAKYNVSDEIVTLVVTESAAIRSAIEQFQELLCAETKSRELGSARGDADASAEVEVAGAAVWLGVKKG